MTRNINYISMVVLAVACLAACSPKKRTEADAARKAAVTVDTTLYVRVDRLGADSAHVTALENSRRFTFGYKEAAQAGKLVGEVREGDTIAIMPDFKRHAVRQGVNVSMLTGLWMLEGGDGSGMRLLADGGAYTVGTNGVTLKSWRVLNGQMLVSYIMDDGSSYAELTDTSRIEVLEKDRLVMLLHGKQQTYHRNAGLITAGE